MAGLGEHQTARGENARRSRTRTRTRACAPLRADRCLAASELKRKPTNNQALLMYAERARYE